MDLTDEARQLESRGNIRNKVLYAYYGDSDLDEDYEPSEEKESAQEEDYPEWVPAEELNTIV